MYHTGNKIHKVLERWKLPFDTRFVTQKTPPFRKEKEA